MRYLALFLLVLVALPVFAHKPTLADRSPPYEVRYHSAQEIVSLTLSLNSSPYVDVRIIGHSVLGKPILAVRIATSAEPKPAIVMVFNQHGREYITAETALFLEYYLEAVLRGSVDDPNATAILSAFDVYIIPLANPDGHDVAMFQNERQRKNAEPIDEDNDGIADEDPPEDANGDGFIDLYYSTTRRYLGAEGVDNDGDGSSGEDRVGGVDPNRNRPRLRGEPAGPADEVYPGPKPLSEPETRSIYEFLKSLGPVALFDVHSGIKALLYPPGTEYGSTALQRIYSEMARVTIKHGRSAMPSVELYPAYGTLEDTGYFDVHAISATFEIFRNSSRPRREETENGYRYYGVKRMFNPMPEKLLDAIREAAGVLLDNAYVIREFADELPAADVSYRIYGDTLYVSVEPREPAIREAFALLIGANMTRYIPLNDNLAGSLEGTISLDSSGLRDAKYALIVLYHGVLKRNLTAFELTISGVFHDSDDDGMDDEREAVRNVSGDDADSDGLSNYAEYLIGTNPANNDTDFDGIPDSEEYAAALLAAFRGSGFSNVPYAVAGPGATFLNSSAGVLAEAIGLNRSIEFSGDADFYAVRDLAFAFYRNATNITIVVRADGRSRIFHRHSGTAGTVASRETVPIRVIAAIVAALAIAVAIALLRRSRE